MTSELAIVYSMLILADDGIEISQDKIQAILTAANVEVESIWISLFVKAFAGKDIKELLMNVGSAPAVGAPAAASTASAAPETKAEAPKEEPKEESDEDMGFGLFD